MNPEDGQLGAHDLIRRRMAAEDYLPNITCFSVLIGHFPDFLARFRQSEAFHRRTGWVLLD